MSHASSPAVRAAAARARWLAELASTLDHASKLLRRMSETEAKGREAIALDEQVAALRREVDLIRRGRHRPIEVIDPYRIS